MPGKSVDVVVVPSGYGVFSMPHFQNNLIFRLDVYRRFHDCMLPKCCLFTNMTLAHFMHVSLYTRQYGDAFLSEGERQVLEVLAALQGSNSEP